MTTRVKKLLTAKQFAILALRKSSYRWIPREEARRLAKIGRNQYKCSDCSKIFGRKDTKIDHINPVVPVSGWVGFDSYVDRLYCETIGFQVLCKDCHSKKTKIENIERKRLRNLTK